MAEKKTKKEKVEIATRAPQKRGIFDNLGKDRQQNVKHPLSEIIIFPGDEKESLEDITHADPLDHLPAETKKYPVAPAKDYAKLPNSIRRAIKQGAFQGCSLQIYLYLYSLTRGAIQARRTVRTTKPKIKAGADVGSDVTLNKHLNHLKSSGYLKITEIRGQYHGNEYEIFIPEEVFTDGLEGLDHLDGLDPQFLDHLDGLETRPSRPSQTIANTATYKTPKTSFKDNTKNDDDYALAKFADVLDRTSRKLTAKGLSKSDEDNWKELAELLTMELEIAAARTKSISNVPAFLCEHLRRRLVSKKDLPRARADLNNPIADSEEMTNAEADEPEPLTEQGKETVLKTMREYINRGQSEFVMNLRGIYTAEDWEWLESQLKNQEK